MPFNQFTAMKKLIIRLSVFLFAVALFFRLFCGIFVMQPLGNVPEGNTIVYWRSGLDLPFVASPDGILEKTGLQVSLLGRGLVLSEFYESVQKRRIAEFHYSELFYLWSTGGQKFDIQVH